jgi:hypothetical protein
MRILTGSTDEAAVERWLTPTLITLCLLALPLPARADCIADAGSATLIQANGVTVDCDTDAPNPFTDGIGSLGTNTNLTVNIADGAAIDTTDVGVSLAGGGILDNQGDITAVDTAVVVSDALGTAAPDINNDGSLVSTAGAGIEIAPGFEDATIENSGSIDAATIGIIAPAGTVDNSGTIAALLAGADLTGGDFTNSGDIDVTDAAGVGVIASDTAIGNTGTIVSAGEGLRLSLQSSLDNSGTIDAGSAGVTLESGSSLDNTGSITSASGAAVMATGGANIVNSGSLTGSGEAVLLSGGDNTLFLGTGSSVSGAIRSDFAGAPTDSLFLDGEGSFGGLIENFGTLVMQGTSWSLSGNVSAQLVSLTSGRLDINGSLDTRVGSPDRGTVTLASQAALGGVGTVIANVENSAGVLAPGSPTGTLTIDGDYLQGAQGVMRVASTAGSRVGFLRVTGTATLAGVVEVQAGSDGIFDVLTADNGIVGAFDELRVDGRALVSLLSTPNTVRIVRASTTAQDNVVYSALDAAVLTLDGLNRGGRSDGGNGPWITGLGHYGDKDEVDSVPGGDFTIYGGMAGLDWTFGNVRVGAGGGYTKTDLDIDDGGEGDVDNTVYGAFVEYVTERFHGSLTVSGGSNEFNHQRSIFINDARSVAEADYDGDTLAIRVAVGGNMPMRGEWRETWVFEPELRADYILLDLDPYTETGGLGLEFEAADDIEAAEFAGLFHVRRRDARGLGLTPRAHIGVVHRIAIDDREWTAKDTTSGTNLLLPGDDNDVTSFRVGVGADLLLGRNLQASVDYLGEFGDDAESHTLMASLKILL